MDFGAGPELTVGNWIAIVAVLIGAVSASFAAANYLAGRRERIGNALKSDARVKLTINATDYENGWRSVQLHVIPTDAEHKDFGYSNWVIERATLVRPKNAVLARAENDDYATGVFYPEQPVRVLAGKAEGKPQRFALEFFVKVAGDEPRQILKVKVVYWSAREAKRQTEVVSATMP